MPRFAQFSEAAADTLQAYYSAFAKSQFDTAMALWTDEDSVSLICADGTYLKGIENIGRALALQFKQGHITIEPLEMNAYESAGTVIYVAAEAHHGLPHDTPKLIFATYVMNREYGKWRISHIHLSPITGPQTHEFAARLKQSKKALH